MRPVRFFFGLLLGVAALFLVARLLFMVFIGLAGLALVAFVGKGVARLAMTAGINHDRGYGYPGHQMEGNSRYFEALPIDPYANIRSELYVSHRSIEVL